jgi:Ca2+-binding EF-hand superfamily protein
MHFNRADKTGAGSLSAAQVAALMRVALAGPEAAVASAASSSSGAAGGAGVGAGGRATLSELEVQDLLSEVDVGTEGGEGRADFDEFVHLFCRRFAPPPPPSNTLGGGNDNGGDSVSGSAGASLLRGPELAELKSCFAALDLDGDELLSSSDLREALATLAEERFDQAEIEAMLAEVDTTGRGKITLADFLAALTPA